jgi:hypothetical protein
MTDRPGLLGTVATLAAALVFGAALSLLCIRVAGAAQNCPDQGDPAKPRVAEWGAKCGPATGSCMEPYRCLWPPNCVCDFQPLGMTRDPQADGWQKSPRKPAS